MRDLEEAKNETTKFYAAASRQNILFRDGTLRALWNLHLQNPAEALVGKKIRKQKKKNVQGILQLRDVRGVVRAVRGVRGSSCVQTLSLCVTFCV